MNTPRSMEKAQNWLHTISGSGRGGGEVKIDRFPRECPRCHVHSHPMEVFSLSFRGEVQAVYCCQNSDCGRLYFAIFSPAPESGIMRPPVMGEAHIERITYRLKKTEPLVPTPQEFSEEITSLSPRFVEIYNQAAIAEASELADIAGVGYGKSLEILIKDYLIGKASGQSEIDAIKAKFLGQCIQQDIQDERIKEAAKMATFLRNDETHYERRFTDMDVSNLKELIGLVVAYIDYEKRHEIYKRRFA